MGITERKWTVHEAGDPEKVGRLATELGVDRVLAELLVQRGVETFDASSGPAWTTSTTRS